MLFLDISKKNTQHLSNCSTILAHYFSITTRNLRSGNWKSLGNFGKIPLVSSGLEYKYSARWVLPPASIRGVEVAKASAAAKPRGWESV